MFSPPNASINSFVSEVTIILRSYIGFSAQTCLHRFRELFGTTPKLCVLLWREKVSRPHRLARTKHMPWV